MRQDLVTIAVVALLPAAAAGGGYSAPNVNPADLAMAGSRVAAQDGAAAVFGNPSALARIEGLNLSVAGAVTDVQSTWTDPTGRETPSTSATNTSLMFTPAVYASYGFRLPNDMAVGVGGGLTIPFGGDVSWPGDWPGRFEIVNAERRIYATYLSGGIEPLPWLRVGAGLVWYHGTENFSRAISAVGAQGRGEVSTSGDAFSYDLSAELQPIERLRLGIDYKHQAVMSLDGRAHVEGALAQLGLVDQAVQHPLTIPNQLAVGASYRVIPILLVTGAFTWERYVVYDKDVFTGSSGVSIVVPRKDRNGYAFRFGAEGGPVNGFKVRLGVVREIAPTPPEWLHPSIPESDVWGASVGIAYTIIADLELSASYFHAWFDEARTCRVTGGQCQPNNVFPGIYDTRANIASIGLSWNAGSWRR